MLKKNSRTYSDYLINYYFNDELLLNMTVDEFYKIVDPNIWSDVQINPYVILAILQSIIQRIIQMNLFLKEVKNIILHL